MESGYQNHNSDLTHEVLAARKRLQQLQKKLRKDFDHGVPISAIWQKRVKLCDEILIQAWKIAGLHYFPALSLVAVGGFGRGELYPFSDIDILILVPNENINAAHWQAALTTFLTFLWDIGLQVGHSVRTLDECISTACIDISVATTLLETRLLCGDTFIYQRLRNIFFVQAIWPMRFFLQAKKAEQVTRYQKYKDTAYNLEPNIKEGPGALRDLQLINWLMLRYFGLSIDPQLIASHFLSEEEITTLQRAHLFLGKIRCGLHFLAGRKEDRLLFDYQKELASWFGYPESQAVSMIEQFMKDYYRTVMHVSVLTELMLQTFEEMLLPMLQERSELISNEILLNHGRLEVMHDQVFANNPSMLLRIFYELTTRSEAAGISAITLRLIRQQTGFIDDNFRSNKLNQAFFIAILHRLEFADLPIQKSVLEMMYRYGLLAAYMPSFGKISGQVQFDLFHVYTVDRHIMYVVGNLLKFRKGEDFGIPLCAELMQLQSHPEILYLAGLFHDIAKGRHGDHSELGREDAWQFCELHGMSEEQCELVSWLVEQHLLFSLTAQRKDLQDPIVIRTFAQEVGSVNRLQLLFLLTIADICATNPSLWNSWRATLLVTLYHKTHEFLLQKKPYLQLIDSTDKITRRVLKHLEQMHLPVAPVKQLWANLDEKYFTRHPFSQIRWHSEVITEHLGEDLPYIAIRNLKKSGGTEIFILTKENISLFAVITSTFEQLNLNIVAANIMHTKDEIVLQTYVIIDHMNKMITDLQVQNGIYQTLRRKLLKLNLPALHPLKVPTNRRYIRMIPTTITFYDDLIHQHSVMELFTTDCPGLLARVGIVFTKYAVQVQMAKILTLGHRVEDVFFLYSMERKGCLTTDEQENVKNELLKIFPRA